VTLTGLDSDVVLSGLDSDMHAEALPQAEPIAIMPEEPAEAEEHLKVSFRMPAGQRITRRFRPIDSVEQMFNAASALSEQPVRLIELSTQFPKRSLRDIEGGLETLMKDAQVAGSVVLVNVRAA